MRYLVLMLKSLGFLAVSLILLFIFLVNFTATESRFECAGIITSKDGSRPLTLYLKLEEYRWWWAVWSKSKGSMYVEVPTKYVEYFGNLERAGEQIQVRDMENEFRGIFSTLSKKIGIQLPLNLKTDLFEGDCKRIEN